MTDVFYPDDLPPPSKSYSIQVGVGLIVNKMNAGNTRTRRRHNKRIRTMACTFDLTQQQAQDWSWFMKQNGYKWFWMPMVFENQRGTETADRQVKLVSEWSLQYLSVDAWQATCTIEAMATS